MTLATYLDQMFADFRPHTRHEAHERYCRETGSRMAFDTFSRKFRDWRRERPWIVDVPVAGKQWCRYQHAAEGQGRLFA